MKIDGVHKIRDDLAHCEKKAKRLEAELAGAREKERQDADLDECYRRLRIMWEALCFDESYAGWFDSGGNPQ